MMPPPGPAAWSSRLPGHTWLGLLVLAAGQFGLFRDSPLAATWLTPIMWSGYILALDGVNFRLRGLSWLTTRRREFPLLVLLSVAVWLVFEGYNLHLVNWVYRGLPSRALVRDFGYFWSFATIMPGVFQTADFVEALFERASGLRATGRSATGQRAAAQPRSVGPAWLWWLAGIAMVSLPLALPNPAAAHTFAAVWIGFFLILDPLNERLGLASIRAQWAGGHRAPHWHCCWVACCADSCGRPGTSRQSEPVVPTGCTPCLRRCAYSAGISGRCPCWVCWGSRRLLSSCSQRISCCARCWADRASSARFPPRFRLPRCPPGQGAWSPRPSLRAVRKTPAAFARTCAGRTVPIVPAAGL